jgi:hypothetical protein
LHELQEPSLGHEQPSPRRLDLDGEELREDQNQQNMPERRMQFGSRAHHRPRAIAGWQMIVEKPLDRILVEASGLKLASAHPAPEVGQTTKVFPMARDA